ncbi:MAG TPA: lipid-A-disaccharide synthase [Candidatus Dormibacteraeota bacterium]|nr:lipid-A-disaccharide synthase [Candidatus Dormibacteraeota bacterium]
MNRPVRVLILAGEASGDLYGGLLMRAMGARVARPGQASSLQFTGAGGPTMQEAGLQPLGDAASMGVTGVLEVLLRLPAIWRVFTRARRSLSDARTRPDLAILIDYPDFNLRLARVARQEGVPVLYVVSPQIWAWRRGRLRQIAERVDRMLVILPFEEEIYRRAGVPVEFVGHPLLDLVRPERSREQTLSPLGLDARRPTVALLPGSRGNELRAHLPAMSEAALILRDEFRDLQFLIPVAPTFRSGEVESLLRGDRASVGTGAGRPGGRPWVLVRDGRYDAVAASDAAVVASGTATLETALLGVPMVIVYRMNPITYALARAVSKIQHIGMPNLIAGDRIVPELVQGACRPERIAQEIRRLLTDRQAASQMRRDLAGVRSRLGRPGAIERMAAAAWDMIGSRRNQQAAGKMDGSTAGGRPFS